MSMKEWNKAMSKAQLSRIFLDTSIMIVRDVHGKKTKGEIKRLLGGYSRQFTSLIVRQEYKRRLLKEADYLLRQLDRYKSLEEVQHHIAQLNMPLHKRKQTISLHLLAGRPGLNDEEATERLMLDL